MQERQKKRESLIPATPTQGDPPKGGPTPNRSQANPTHLRQQQIVVLKQ